MALMASTGILLSFQDNIIHALNPKLIAVSARYTVHQRPLPIQKIIQNLDILHSDCEVARIFYDPSGIKPSYVRCNRSLPVFFDPYTGKQIAPPYSQGFFASVENVHRRLALGRVGEIITGFCAVSLLFLSFSGIYLRWPRDALWSWRTWLYIDVSTEARKVILRLHSVLGTLLLCVYVVIGITGVFWSYGWVNHAITQALGGVSLSSGGQPTASPRAQGQSDKALAAQISAIDAQNAWSGHVIDIRFSNAGLATTLVRVLPTVPEHLRAYDIYQLEGTRIIRSMPYLENHLGQRILANVFGLHTGSAFGLVGRVFWLMAVTGLIFLWASGIWAYIQRRQRFKRPIASQQKDRYQD